MASGYGLHGGVSRCFPFWQEVLACYAVNADNDNRSGIRQCKPALEDYMECLHHNKEAAKIRTLQAAYRKREAQTPRDEAPSAGEIRSLGLLKATNAEVAVNTGSDVIPTMKDNLPRAKGDKPVVH